MIPRAALIVSPRRPATLGAVIGLALLGLAAGPAAASEREGPRFKGWTGPKPQIDCRCRLPGEKVELGVERCLIRSGEAVTARCEKPLNLPYWRVLRKGCDQPII